MPVPRQRHTKSKRNRNRSHLALKPLNVGKCLKCHEPILPHIACKNCGTYKGVQVIDVLKKLTKREQKKKQRELDAQEQEKAQEARV